MSGIANANHLSKTRCQMMLWVLGVKPFGRQLSLHLAHTFDVPSRRRLLLAWVESRFQKAMLLLLAALLFIASPFARPQEPSILRAEAEQLMTLTNQARAKAGVPPLRWDPALAEAARKHTMRMVSEGPIAHIYPGELQLSERAGLAGAHFDVIAENIGIGADPAQLQDAWMHSKGHRENMLNPEVNRVGIAVIASRGVLYATTDFARAVENLTGAEVEERVAALIVPS